MELIDTGINWISWAGAAYVVGTTIFLVVNIAIGAVRAKSALWWFLIYSVVVVGMMLAGLKYLPAMVLAYSNDGLEAAEPEMQRFTHNINRIFNTAADASRAGADPLVPPATPSPPPPDPNAGGGTEPLPIPTPIAGTPTPTPPPGIDYDATADARLATITAAAADYQPPTPTPTYDILKPPTPIIRR
jgi:hypothetical protein